MTKFTIENTKTFLEKQGDYYTIRLLNRNMVPPRQYIFALLWLDGNAGLWMARFVEQNMRPVFEQSTKGFSQAKQILVDKIGDYASKGYIITVLSSCYDILPWLQRKR